MKKIILILILFTGRLFAGGDPLYHLQARHAMAYELAASNPFGISPAEMELFYYYKTAELTVVQYVLKNTQTVLTIVQESDLDSAETVTASITSPNDPGTYFDASIYNNANDSTLYGMTVDGGNDSARAILLGTVDGNVTAVALDTFVTNKTTYIQRLVDVDEAGKFIFPFWGMKYEGIDCSNATVRTYFLNNKKIITAR